MAINGGDIGLIVSLLNLVGLIYFLGVWKGQIDVRVDTIWDVYVKSALTDARQAGVLKQNSPLELSDNVNEHFERNAMISKKLLELYRFCSKRGMSDSGIIFEFARRFGDEMDEYVCKPLGINFGSALAAALQYCKERGDN